MIRVGVVCHGQTIEFNAKDTKKNPNPKIYTDFWDCNPKNQRGLLRILCQ